MRVISATQQGVLSAGAQAEHVRVSTKDSSGAFQILGSSAIADQNYPGFNAVKSLGWSERVEDPHASFELMLHRELNRRSLAPLMQNSPLNRGYNPSAAYAALLGLNRIFKIEVAIVPSDRQPLAGDWVEYFQGRIEGIDPANGYGIQVRGRALSGRLAQQYIKLERVYSYGSVAGTAVSMRIWLPNTAYALNEYLLPASRGANDPGYNRFFKCSLAGTSGAGEPVWSGGTGIVDGSAHWDFVSAPTTTGNPMEQIAQQILNDNLGTGDTAPTLLIPSPTSWNIRQFLQAEGFTSDAVRALATQIGWDVRFKWDANSSSWKYTLYAPTRTSPAVNFTFAKSDYELTKLGVDVATIRNFIEVTYSDWQDLEVDGTPKRKSLTFSDSASITKYGELYCKFQEAWNSGIDSSTEATTFGNAALSDMKEPTAEMGASLKFGFPWVELNDYFTFKQNALHFDSDQSLAVTSYAHSWDGGKLRTRLELRGFPTIGAKTYLQNSIHPNHPEKGKPPGVHQKQHFQGKATPSVSLNKVIGGARAVLAVDLDKNTLVEEYEHHVYPTPGTALSSGTLVTIAKDRNVEFANLLPGDTYYHRTVPRTRNGDRFIRGQPSVEQSFVAGQVTPLYLDNLTIPAAIPMNGSFEGWTRASDGGRVPDHCSMVTGTWFTDAVRLSTDRGDGQYCVQLTNTAVATKMQFDAQPCGANVQFVLEALLKKVATPTNSVKVGVDWLDSTQTLISTSTVTTALTAIGAGWSFVGNRFVSPANTCFARCWFAKNDNGTFACNFDAIKLVPIPSDSLNVSTFGPAIFTVSSTFATVASGTFTQDKGSQLIRVVGGTTAFANVAGKTVKFRALFNSAAQGTDHPLWYNVAAQHLGWPLCWQFNGPALPGSYTLAIQWMSVDNVSRFDMDANDYLTVVAF